MFNWFKRNKKQEEKDSKTTTPPETKTSESDSQTEDKQEEYLQFAKAAYQNIQKKKQQSDTTTTEENSNLEEETKETTTTENIVETENNNNNEIAKTTTTENIVEIEDNNSEIKETETETTTKEETKNTSTPVWMKKSQGLEKLKETAIQEPEPEETKTPELDEDFIWSAKVLAKEGRTAEDVSEEEINWLKKLRQGLGKTRRSLIVQLKAVVGQGVLNKDAIEEIEALLLQADVGIEATDYIIELLQEKLKEEALDPDKAIAYLKSILQDILNKPLVGREDRSFTLEKDILNIWLLTGVNGAGKTTTVGKLANLAKNSGYNCLIAAADTFRAAAVQQVTVWGERTNTEVIANQGKNIDPASVVYNAITAANSRNTELLLVDTAGRLQNKKNLMDELAKIRRVIGKNAPDAKIESLLVLDATLGQNGLLQAKVFSEAAKLSGVVLTKLDGSSKGGIALAVAQQLNLPILFVGVGEGIEDLRPFSSYEFVEALLNG